MYSISDGIERKFTEILDASEWLIETDTGWEELIDIKETIPYQLWSITLDNGMKLSCADDHIVFDTNMNEKFIKDIAIGDSIQTINGHSTVIDITSTNDSVNMYDVGVNSNNHRYYTNGILSHNTTCAAGYLLWFAMFTPDKTLLIAAHKYSGSQEIMQRIRFAYEDCPDFIRAGVTSYNRGSIELDNGSRIVSTTTTENTGRGLSISLLYLDEASHIPTNIQNALWSSISPTLSTGGKAIITSTPNTDEDLFATIWKGANDKFDEYGNETIIGRNGFFACRTYWHEHPDRDEKWAATERAKIGESLFSREFDCNFVTFEETLINPMLLATMDGRSPVNTVKNVRWYKELSTDMTYVVSLDPSLGTGGDNAAIEIFELPSMEQVGEWQHNLTPIDSQIKLLREILIYISDTTNNSSIYWSIENNSLGEAGLICIRETGEEKFPGVLLSEPKKKGVYTKQRKGFTTTNKSKLAAAARLKYLIESGKMNINSKPLISELKNYIASGAGFAAKAGKTDDLISAVLVIIRMTEILAGWDISISNVFTSDDSEEEIDEYDYPMPIFAHFS